MYQPPHRWHCTRCSSTSTGGALQFVGTFSTSAGGSGDYTGSLTTS